MMPAFEYRDGELYCEETPLARLADEVGTPCYVYSRRALSEAFDSYRRAFAPVEAMICFAVKSNGNLALLRLLAGLGAGMDIVSGGELFRALRAGTPAARIVYSGVGKTDEELAFAVEQGIFSFNVESLPELEVLDRIARRLGKPARVSLRVNPDVTSNAHEYTATGHKATKFGIPYSQALETYRGLKRFEGLRVCGMATHIGSQITELEPFIQAYQRLAELFDRLRREGLPLEVLDIGGGLGIRYKQEQPPTPADFAEAVLPVVAPLGCRIIVEPGRSICGNAGALLSRVLYFKQTPAKNFAIIDAGMNDLIRPSLYGAYHEVLPVRENSREALPMDVVGPICETGDWLARDRLLPSPARGDLLAVMSAGAYGFAMSSNYNSRPRPAEVLVEGDRYRVVRRAESYEDLLRAEEA